MSSITRSTRKETALLNKLAHLPATPRRTIHLRRFDFSGSTVLCWIHCMQRGSRRYSLQCEVQDDGSLEVSVSPSLVRKSCACPKKETFSDNAWLENPH